jgi:ElaB/YqjD/DUF883 family membrane-anchored ribosome-binding protein
MLTPTTPADSAMAERAAAGIDRLTSGAHAAVDRVADKASSAAARLDNTREQLMAAQARLMQPARERVRRYPIVAVGLAIGLGLLLSRMGSHQPSQHHH